VVVVVMVVVVVLVVVVVVVVVLELPTNIRLHIPLHFIPNANLMFNVRYLQPTQPRIFSYCLSLA